MRPRISVIVPYCRDEAAFETTLVSVLENRPLACEVLVPHDGSYRDPFDLSDEVRFVVAEGESSLVGLVDAAIQSARSGIINLLTGGVRATSTWTVEPIDQLGDQSTGAVAPIVWDVGRDERILAAGWRFDRRSIYAPVGQGESRLTTALLAQVHAPYLAASFWRRDVLAACLEAGIGLESAAAELAIGTALRDLGLDCQVSQASRMIGCQRAFHAPDQTAIACETYCVRLATTGQGAVASTLDAAVDLATAPFSPAAWKRAIGRLTAVASHRKEVQHLSQQMRVAQQLWNELDSAHHTSTLPMPSTGFTTTRRAA